MKQSELKFRFAWLQKPRALLLCHTGLGQGLWEMVSTQAWAAGQDISRATHSPGVLFCLSIWQCQAPGVQGWEEAGCVPGVQEPARPTCPHQVMVNMPTWPLPIWITILIAALTLLEKPHWCESLEKDAGMWVSKQTCIWIKAGRIKKKNTPKHLWQ